jgi:hypothetical protein
VRPDWDRKKNRDIYIEDEFGQLMDNRHTTYDFSWAEQRFEPRKRRLPDGLET